MCDNFENFCLVCLEAYKFDCAHYFTVPGCAFDTMLSYTKTEFELLTHYEKILLFEKGEEGDLGLYWKHSFANNKYISETFDSSKPSIFLTNLLLICMCGKCVHKFT